MITVKDFVEAIEHKITGGSEYCWKCFGDNARYLDCDDTEDAGSKYHVGAVFDSQTQQVYIIEVWDYLNDREYRWIDPHFQKAHNKESKKRDVDRKESMDGRNYIDLDLAEDILEKANALVNGIEYDTRVKVPVDFTDEELLQYMKMAHERDMTFNQFVEEALRFAIEEHKAGRLTKEDAQQFIRERNENHSSV